MTRRKRIGAADQAEVLLASGRRCCLCYGLQGDFGVKRGQIAHLDGDASNSRTDNLVFLCLEHHDAFDSRPSQSKGLMREELLFYRAMLYRDVTRNLPRPADDASLRLRDVVSSFRRAGEQTTLLNGAEIRRAVELSLLGIDPHDNASFRAASYGLRVGEQLFIDGKAKPLIEGEPIRLEPGQLAVIASEEFLSLPPGILGRLVPVAGLDRLGISVAAGCHIDPGFRGRLILPVENRSMHPFEIRRGTVIAAVEFALLAPMDADSRR